MKDNTTRGVPMPSYRRHVARHPLALARARRYVRRHATETQAYPIGTPPLPRRTRSYFATFRDTLPVPDGERVVAYRTSAMGHEKLLRCTGHALPAHPGTLPLTSDDLPDGGICTWPGCGRDVLIPQCLCSNGSPENYDGPAPDCPVHGDPSILGYDPSILGYDPAKRGCSR